MRLLFSNFKYKALETHTHRDTLTLHCMVNYFLKYLLFMDMGNIFTQVGRLNTTTHCI